MMRRVVTGLMMTLALAAVCRPAHAGMFEWVDDMFTFRKDQKPRVSPRRLLPPKVVEVPYYDEHAGAQWNNYYTRQDLVPETYLAGSGSKVMRPDDGYYGGRGEDQAEVGNVVVGQPGEGAGMEMYDGNGQDVVHRETKLGAAVRDWRQSAPQNGLGTSRPGDFDYRWNGQRQADADGTVENLGGSGGFSAHRARPLVAQPQMLVDGQGDARYTKRNAQGQVTQYQVQHGDSLGGIAGQPAIYADWKLWPLIYSANRKTIGADPDGLKYQQKLAIPRNYTKAQAKDATERALKRKPGVAGDGH
jgi:hypothetical protein